MISSEAEQMRLFWVFSNTVILVRSSEDVAKLHFQHCAEKLV